MDTDAEMRELLDDIDYDEEPVATGGDPDPDASPPGEPALTVTAPTTQSSVNIPATTTDSTKVMNSDSSSSRSEVSCSNGTSTYVNCLSNASYIQCKAARTAGLATDAIDVTFGPNAGKTVKIQRERVSSLDMLNDPDLSKCFRGSRISTDSTPVNQNLCTSFDPSTLKCTVCPNMHSIIPVDGSGFVILLSDQNFVPSLSGKETCIPVVRLEDANLSELADLALEILDRHTIPPGTVFMFNSTSHLSKVGTTKFTYDWLAACNKITLRWRQARTGPLPPVLREDSTSNVGRQLIELDSWFRRVYSGSPVFVTNAWNKVIETISTTEETGLDLGHREVYSVAMPTSLSNRTMLSQTFIVSSSHTVTQGFDGVATDGLLRDLIDGLASDFACRANSGDILCREQAEPHVPMELPSKPIPVINIGASHSKRLAGMLRMRNCDVTDLSVPGWLVTEKNVESVEAEVKKLSNTGEYEAVIDLFSNSTYKYETEDGTLAPPMKIDGVYHMAGKVSVCNKETIENVISKSKSLLNCISCKKLFLTPLPRYLYTSCCDRDGHCPGTGTLEHVTKIVDDTLSLKKKIANGLIKNGITNFVVIDVLSCFGGNTPEIVENVKDVSSSDGVHLVSNGYSLLADKIRKELNCTSVPLVVNVSGSSNASRGGYFWRGFLSPVGTPRPKQFAQSYKHSRQAGGKWKKAPTGGRGGNSSGSTYRGRGTDHRWRK